MRSVVFIALGTNLGDRVANLRQAIESLEPAVIPVVESFVYETPPVGYSDQGRFLNQVIKAETDLSPTDLLVFLKGIEKRMGRVTTFKDGPRIIDLDILFYDNQILELENLIIPHPRLHERAFVLVPLADIEPELIHPSRGLSIQELLSQTSRDGIELYPTQ